MEPKNKKLSSNIQLILNIASSTELMTLIFQMKFLLIPAVYNISFAGKFCYF